MLFLGSILINTINLFVQVFFWLILIRAILSFMRPGYNRTISTLESIVYQATEPILAPIRRVMPPTGMIDFSPLVALILLRFLGNFLVRIIHSLFY